MIIIGLIFVAGLIFLLRNFDKKKKRVIVSLTLLVTSIIMPISALIYHVTGHESKFSHAWLHIHVVFGIIFVGACIYHVVFNWKSLKNNFKSLWR